MYTISQVDVSYFMNHAYARANNTENLIERFVLETAWATTFFKQNAINPMEWQEDDVLIERNELVRAIMNWFDNEFKTDDDIAFWRPSHKTVWKLVRWNYSSLLHGGYIS